MSTNSIGDTPAFPSEFTPGDKQFSSGGMTYRMWLIGRIASGVIQEQWNEAYEITAKTILNRADAIIERLDKEMGER